LCRWFRHRGTAPCGARRGLSAAFAGLFARTRATLAALQTRFRVILDADKEAACLRDEGQRAKTSALDDAQVLERSTSDLRTKYATAFSRMGEFSREVNRLEENLESLEIGVYRPHFTYADTDSYKTAIETVRQGQKDLIKAGRATVCGKQWAVGGSKREGAKMIRQTEKLILRAFNAGAEAALSNVTWNNYDTMCARLEKAAEILNKHGPMLEISLTPEYKRQRLEELQLVYEAAEKRREEKEQQREQRAAQREEERVQRELLKVQEDAAKDETRFIMALTKARAELSAAQESERAAMQARLAKLETDLAAAHDRKERAIAQAQLTKVGHVYIISNVGAFGDQVVKIGMTRRLEPEERVHELGDASVPFPFDVHALIYSDNAPDLKRRLHDHFWDKRLNWANDRKEFFRVPLPDVEAALHELGLQTELQHIPEAREYRLSTSALQAAMAAASASAAPSVAAGFPADPFGDDQQPQ